MNLQILLIVICVTIMMISVLYGWHKLIDRKINYKNYKLYVTLVGMVSTSILNYLTINNFIRIFLITVILMLFFKFLFNENLQKTIITPVYQQLLIMIAEAIFIMILITFFRLDLEQLMTQYLGNFVVNIGIAFVFVILVSIPIIKKVYISILSYVEMISIKFFISLSILLMGILNVLAMVTYYEIDVRISILINVTFSLLCFFIVLYSFKIQNNYNKVSDKYNIAINSLNDYEDMMTKYKIANHENKNLLLTIRAMIINKEKDIPNYIDSIVENKYNDSEKLLFDVGVIPSGGLRATIYSEIMKIKENNIDYKLSIDRKVRTVDLINIDNKTILEACKILCVFIDNAIDEVKKLNKKDILIDLYIEDNSLCVKISNNYGDKIDVDKIFLEGYTTKGNGHGYGLPLVKQIIENNSIFKNEIEINSRLFSQKLLIKLK